MIPDNFQRFINNEKSVNYHNYDLSAITSILKELHDPHLKIKTIHIAGTNGKGSVAHMLNHLFLQNGYNVGLYTSPHLLKLHERIVVNNQPISDSRLNSYVERIISAMEVTDSVPTFFDVITICAFLYFEQAVIDYAIIETGLGGRLDSTNVIMPECSIITTISRDHTHILGNSISEIAAEKAGIIKDNVPLIVARQTKEAMRVVVHKSLELKSPLFRFDTDFLVSNIRTYNAGYEFNFTFNNKAFQHDFIVRLPFYTSFQVENAALALAAFIVLTEKSRMRISETRFGFDNLRIPGRFEILNHDPPVIFDPSHNIQAISALCSTLVEHFNSYEITIVLSLMRDKKIDHIFKIIQHHKWPIIYMVLPGERFYNPDTKGPVQVVPDLTVYSFAQLQSYLLKKLSENKRRLLVFTGSFQMYGTAISFARELSAK